ncbi:Glyoxalase/bleomycin resistance protein/dioxygenase [Bosea sp. 62]|uniref:VOC family protein n=1 Tax=unclassified Bosea (in: a-proteobacteria) TaxID=2653178 RepID=UPI001256449E|nr:MULTISPECIES: VOC family protein [unclassified Bosea (in: a-proteobacteria)]CAD5267024.1 Glyoxalase/bleomycin resistance protein/dioxygenase [Bosea sp. 46]CAD5268548.1 Glyoxalase/bleomycin resistance protein/dioxygenase [Bosea sp. 21B]CAD5270066.1 Glyoxalase/bleomycin resistance protein/dioxygenase [Bosea sp. 7B]VVT62428.1 Glyoxalase/bleomycin resistance protein/dioxygenase [Bosea sp. EC-HK365B]VXB92654.1 Glyoxalase/bleomycin resistance protein/dioxygenase [Bosea sp. 29B]
MILELHHIQLAMPEGREEEARAFYCNVLGLREVDKPEELRARGGVWFESGTIKVHLGVETPFSPARKAHPAFRVESLEQAIATLRLNGVKVRPDVDLPGIRRSYVDDPFGNRIELLELT